MGQVICIYPYVPLTFLEEAEGAAEAGVLEEEVLPEAASGAAEAGAGKSKFIDRILISDLCWPTRLPVIRKRTTFSILFGFLNILRFISDAL